MRFPTGDALLILLILLIAGPAHAFEGLVVGISDGDTLTVLHDRAPVRVRLAEIDAPERGQAFGTRSRQALATLCFQKAAAVEDRGRDQYGRTVGYVRCAGVDANAEQVRAGLAWVYDRYSESDSPLYALQDEARSARRGLWVDTEPIAPLSISDPAALAAIQNEIEAAAQRIRSVPVKVRHLERQATPKERSNATAASSDGKFQSFMQRVIRSHDSADHRPEGDKL